MEGNQSSRVRKPLGLRLNIGNATAGLWETFGKPARGSPWREHPRRRQDLAAAGLSAALAALPQQCL